jgi:hypothetical protein
MTLNTEITGKPAHADLCQTTTSPHARVPCRSWLASDGGMTFNTEITGSRRLQIRVKPLHQPKVGEFSSNVRV